MTDSSQPLSQAILTSPTNQQHCHSQPHPTPHSSSSSYVLDIHPPVPPLLLDVATPVRSMIWQYMDDRTAIHYLSTCHSLHGDYHHYPLKQPLTAQQFSSADYMYGRLSWYSRWLTLLAGRLCNRTLPHLGCCQRDGYRRLKGSRIPRVITVTGTVWSSLLPYLKHVVEADVADDDSLPVGPYNPLPRSLRTLRLHDSPNLTLEHDTLPPRLTALTLGRLKRGRSVKGRRAASLARLTTPHW